jgi:hypothetical protein
MPGIGKASWCMSSVVEVIGMLLLSALLVAAGEPAVQPLQLLSGSLSSPLPLATASPSVLRGPSASPSASPSAIPGVDMWGQAGRDAQHTRRSPLQAPAG